jgi:hypothetical protein
MILTFLDFFRRGLPTHKKISFLGGPAHFVTYGGDDGGDGLVDNNNALTTMASALKIHTVIVFLAFVGSFSS